jgi:transposase
MTLHVQPIPSVPDATAAAAHAIFPDGNVYMTIRDQLGTIFTDAQFAPWFSEQGAPVEVAPWRVALVLVMQHMEGLTDRQAADAVRRCIDWKYLLGLELTDPGFDFTLLHDFRDRILANAGEQQLLDSLLAALKARGLLASGGKQRTDATHVLAAIRTLNRLECVGEAMRHALNLLASVAPHWLRSILEPAWLERYQTRFDDFRLPSELTKRSALALTIGQDGITLLQAIYAPTAPEWLREVEAVETLRRIWVQQYTFKDGQVCWRTDKELPPNALLIVSPYDRDARFSHKRETYWTGYKLHVTESCDDERPHLITHVETTPASTQDVALTEPIQADLAAHDLSPHQHLVDTAYMSSELIVQSRSEAGIELIGPVPPDTSWQARDGQGYDVGHFQIDWQAQQVTCPQGQQSAIWRAGDDGRGHRIIHVAFDKMVCGRCAARPQCTRADGRPRVLKLRPQAQHEALQQRRQEQTSEVFKQQYAKRAGIEGTLSQGTRRFDLRRTPYRGQAKTHLHHILLAIAINLTRLVAWLLDDPPPGPYPRQARFATLATGCM